VGGLFAGRAGFRCHRECRGRGSEGEHVRERKRKRHASGHWHGEAV